MDLKRIIEAVLFYSPRPVSVKKLSRRLEISSAEEIEGALNELLAEYNYSERALEIVQVSGGYQIRTKPDYGEWARRFARERDVDLTRSMLETLAIVAYKQPVTKGEIDGVRGVDSARAIKNLLDRKLIEVAGRNGNSGRKMAFRTTVRFLEAYGLNDLKDLPTVKEIESLET